MCGTTLSACPSDLSDLFLKAAVAVSKAGYGSDEVARHRLHPGKRTDRGTASGGLPKQFQDLIDAENRLHKEGERIWGPRWQTPLARALKVSDRTVRRWVSGEVPTKPWLFERLKTQPSKHQKERPEPTTIHMPAFVLDSLVRGNHPRLADGRDEASEPPARVLWLARKSSPRNS